MDQEGDTSDKQHSLDNVDDKSSSQNLSGTQPNELHVATSAACWIDGIRENA